jgi:flagellar biosynthetic protein FlhB
MADEEEKTEDPTDKKKSDAKNEGNVPKSQEIPGAAILTFVSVYLMFGASYLFESIRAMVVYMYGKIAEPIYMETFFHSTYSIFQDILYAMMPLFLLVLILVFATNWAQFGFVAAPMKFDLQKLDPIKGMSNVFSMKKLIEALKLTAKIIIIFVVMVVLFLFTKDDILHAMNKSIESAIDSLVILTIIYIMVILFIVIIFAFIDLYVTRFFYFKSLRMSKQEIKDEYKNMEGDPQVKGRIKQIQRDMSRKSMLQDVKEADVVITNPTHIAVALKYEQNIHRAPVVVAKGADFVALKIKEVARENNIKIIEDKPLARSLYAAVEIEQEIPAEFFKAVAQIFKHLYQLNNK